MVRKITEQSIPANVTASFAAANFTLGRGLIAQPW